MRLTPCLAVMILINDYLVTLQVADGGSSESAFLNYSVIPCRNYWWSAVLHMQNYVNPHEMVSVKVFLISIYFIVKLFKIYFSLVHAHNMVSQCRFSNVLGRAVFRLSPLEILWSIFVHYLRSHSRYMPPCFQGVVRREIHRS